MTALLGFLLSAGIASVCGYAPCDDKIYISLMLTPHQAPVAQEEEIVEPKPSPHDIDSSQCLAPHDYYLYNLPGVDSVEVIGTDYTQDDGTFAEKEIDSISFIYFEVKLDRDTYENDYVRYEEGDLYVLVYYKCVVYMTEQRAVEGYNRIATGKESSGYTQLHNSPTWIKYEAHGVGSTASMRRTGNIVYYAGDEYSHYNLVSRHQTSNMVQAAQNNLPQ